MRRRTFLKRGALFTAGAAFLHPFHSAKANTIPPNTFKPNPADWKESEINIAWIGHATVLINFFGKIILTDPVLFQRVGINILGYTYGPSRYSLPALEWNEIPKPDLILLSHAHMDHMDYQTLSKFADKFPNQIDVITAFNTMDVIEKLEWKSIKELDWGDESEIHEIKIKTLEVKHFGWRYPWERDRSKGYMDNGRSFNAYVLERNGKKILFGGDTAMTPLFEKANLKVDIALMPIGAYNPWKMNHCNPEEALQMAKAVDAKIFIPIHCKTFKQGLEPFEEPIDWLKKSYVNYNVKLGLTNIGETFTLAKG